MSSITKPFYIYKRFRVRRADGVSTTVSVDPTLVIRACKKLGSLSAVSQVVRKTALTYEEGKAAAKNRSMHVARSLEALLAPTQKGSTMQAEETDSETAEELDEFPEMDELAEDDKMLQGAFSAA